MSAKIDQLLAMAESEVNKGASRASIVGGLRDAGASAVEATKVVRALYGVSLREANAIVALDPEWREAQRQSDEATAEYFDRLARGEDP